MATAAKDKNLVPPRITRRFPPAGRYLIGVSGGRDSVALLHNLGASGYHKLIVCHLDHRLRGRSSTADAKFVRDFTAEQGMEFEGGQADVKAFAKEHRYSLETASRILRYGFFVEVARRRRCRTIFLGHHADDLVETFLFNLFRGSSGRTMREVSVHTIGRTPVTIVRPLLGVWRTDIDKYIRAARLEFREDASNLNLEPARNRMRHKIIPALEREFGRAIRGAVWRAAMIGQEEDALLESLSPVATEKLNVRSLGQQPIALQRRAIREWLRRHEVSNVGFDLIESVRALLDPAIAPAKVNLPGDRHARRRAGELFIE